MSVIAPDGTEYRMTHWRVATGVDYRIVDSNVFDLVTKKRAYILADAKGALFTIDADKFNADTFHYRPGGQ